VIALFVHGLHLAPTARAVERIGKETAQGTGSSRIGTSSTQGGYSTRRGRFGWHRLLGDPGVAPEGPGVRKDPLALKVLTHEGSLARNDNDAAPHCFLKVGQK
jgi:hypothetical protein